MNDYQIIPYIITISNRADPSQLGHWTGADPPDGEQPNRAHQGVPGTTLWRDILDFTYDPAKMSIVTASLHERD